MEKIIRAEAKPGGERQLVRYEGNFNRVHWGIRWIENKVCTIHHEYKTLGEVLAKW